MDAKALAKLGQSMRSAQTRYFRSPSGSPEKTVAYRESLALEKEFDKACRDVLSGCSQPGLFRDTEVND